MNQDYEAKFKVGDKIRLYGKETTIRGFYISYNDALNKYETIMLTDGRGDPFERSLGAIEYLDESINQEGSLKDSDWKENNNIINASIASCAFKHPELYTGALCMKCYKSWPLLKECPLDKPDVKEDNTQHKSIQCLDDTIKEVKNLWKGPNKLIAEAVTHLNWAKEKIIKYLNEENVIAPLLQNEYKGDDLVSSDIKIASTVSTRPSSFTNSIEQAEEEEFTPCELCDGSPACEDFGCFLDIFSGKD